jgi:hypothetical protein
MTKNSLGERCKFFEQQYFEPPNEKRIREAADQVRVHRAMLRHVLEGLRGLEITERESAGKTKTLKLVEEPLWKISEAFGKYKTRYFTENAVRSVVERFGKRRSVGLQHDHVVPRKRLVELLFEGTTTLDQVVGLCVGCVVLETEHPGLTAHEQSVDLRDVWGKYRDAGVRVVDCKTGMLVDLNTASADIEGWAKLS